MRSYFLFGVVSAALINHYYYKNEIMKKLGKTYFFLQRAHLGEDKGWVGIFNFFFRSKKNWLDTTLFITECEVFFFETTARIQYIIF
jgi:hypothetical protein